MAARGENIEAVLQSFEASNGTDLGAIKQENASIDQTKTDVADVLKQNTNLSEAMDVTDDSAQVAKISRSAGHNTLGSFETDSQVTDQTQAVLPSTGALNALLPTIQDEAMKNLMMSWYYAGYYTGIQEGQQKAYAEMRGRNVESGSAGAG